MSSDRVRCVVFDIDDTLYLERDYVRSGLAHVGEWAGRNLGIPDFADLAWRAFEEGNGGSIFDHVLQSRDVEPTRELVGVLVDLYRTHEPRIRLVPDAQDCLDGLTGRVTMATVTDGPLESQRAKARALELARWIDPIIFTAELGDDFSKPHPRGFEMVEDMAGHSAGECLYVADNPMKDFIGPKALGWKTMRVRRPASLHYAADTITDVDLEVPDLWGSTALIDQLSAVG